MKEFFTIKEIQHFFLEWDDKPTGLFLENHVFKKYKEFSSGDVVTIGRDYPSNVEIFGFFRSDQIYVIYKGAGKIRHYGWCFYKDIIIVPSGMIHENDF